MGEAGRRKERESVGEAGRREERESVGEAGRMEEGRVWERLGEGRRGECGRGQAVQGGG